MKNIIVFMLVIIVTSCRKDVNIDLGSGYRLITSASMNDLTIVKEYNIGVIRGHILDYAYDSIFIIAAQRPRDSVPGISTMTQKKYEEVFQKSTFRQYWIIDKKKESIFSEKTKAFSNVYGPLKKEEYLKKRKELEVPKELELKIE